MNGDNPEQLTVLISDLLKHAHTSNHRHCIVIAGEQIWTRHITSNFLEQCIDKDIAWLSTSPPENITTIVPEKIQSVLGNESDIIVFDAYSGFNPDAFGAVAGIICGGGLLLLLTPELSNWKNYNDPEYKRITVFPTSPDEMTGRFLKRLSRVIQEHQATTIIEQYQPLPTPSFPVLHDHKSTLHEGAIYKTDDQKNAVEAIKKVVTGHRRRPLVLTSDRGRGKSAALGIAAAQLMQQGVDRIIVTAPRSEAVKILFEHTIKLLENSEATKRLIQTSTSTLEYFPPDELVRNEHKAKLLLVDEAAAIPAPILEQLLKKYSRVVFASTVHGYEGTGRGFAIRFHNTLQRLTPNWKKLEINQPIRWAENDPLEDLTFKSLLLDSNLAHGKLSAPLNVSDLIFERMDRNKLADDESTLQSLFGLLINAHYQTKPSDLRYLLDGPNLSVYVLRKEKTIIATALLAAEGGFNEDIANEIYHGNRRPHGHLTPEVLASHIGIKKSPLLIGARIVRIAVQPSLQNSGIGTFFLDSILKHSSLKNYDYLSSSFGATMDLLNFWKKSNYSPIRIGIQQNSSSGEHSVLMFKPISKVGKEIFMAANLQFFRQFTEQLTDSLQYLEPCLVEFLLRQESINDNSELDELDRENVNAFVNKQRIYEACPASIKNITLLILQNSKLSEQITIEHKKLLIRKVLQKHDWKMLTNTNENTGKKSILENLRTALKPFVKKSL